MDNKDNPVNRRRFLRTGAASVVSLGLVAATEASTHAKSGSEPNSSTEAAEHSELTGLQNDDHLQYFTKSRGDLRYPLREEVVAGLDAKVDESQRNLPNGFVGLDAGAKIPTERFADLSSPQNGDSLILRDGVIVNVLNTYRRLDTEFGVVADGVNDNAAAIQTALNSVRDSQGGTLVFPNGVTKIAGSISTDFNNNRGTVRMLGHGGSSIIHIAGGHEVFRFQNLPKVIVEGLTFIGTPGAVFDFTKNVLFFNVVESAIVRDCRFLGLAVNAPLDGPPFLYNGTHGIVIGVEASLLVEACHFQGNGTINCPNVGVYAWHGLTVRDTLFNDYGYQGAATYSKTPFFDNHYWIRAVNGLLTSGQGFPRSKVMIERSNFDEGHVFAIYVDDAQWVEINNARINTGISSSIYLDNVNRATLTDIYCFKANNPGIISVTATDCENVEVNNLLHAAGVTTLQLLGTTKRARLRGCSDVSFTNTAGTYIDADQPMERTQSAAKLAPLGRITRVVGTRAIEEISTKNLKTGDEITLIFDEVLNISARDNIKIGLDHTTAPNDVLRLVYDGFNFYESTRRREP